MRRLVLARLGIPLLLLVACTPAASTRPEVAPAPPAASAAPSAVPRAPLALRFGLNTPGAGGAPIWIAKEQGFFLRYGIDPELVIVPGADRLVAAMIVGEIPIATIAAPAFLTAALSGADLLLVGSYINRVRFQFFGRPEITSVRDLRGKRIGLSGRAGIIKQATDLVLERNGLDPQRDVTQIAVGTINDSMAALLGGAVDAAMQGPPNIFLLQDEGLPLLDETERYAYQAIQQGIGARRDWIAANEAVTRGVLQAIAAGVAFAHRDPARTREIIAKYTQSDDERLTARTLDAFLPTWERVPSAPLAVLQADLEALAQEVPAASGARADRFLDNRFIEALEREGFFQQLNP